MRTKVGTYTAKFADGRSITIYAFSTLEEFRGDESGSIVFRPGLIELETSDGRRVSPLRGARFSVLDADQLEVSSAELAAAFDLDVGDDPVDDAPSTGRF